MENSDETTNDSTGTGRSSYAPEDNKLRLYVGRVPRAEYEALRAEGWVSTPKQSCDFVAIWTPTRRDTALRYGGGIIEDEDMGPAERAADRAERFGGYRDKRTDEATGRADSYDAGPAAHGFQSAARAERSAARHDRIADRAGDAWSKAEYWTRRTAGVISHALHLAAPGVRMGRIKTLEAEQRKFLAEHAKQVETHAKFVEVAAMTDAAQQNALAEYLVGAASHAYDYKHPRTGKTDSLWSHMMRADDKISGAEACALWLARNKGPAALEDQDWANHYALRLAYENQMLEAQGGRAGVVEMVPGGWLLGGRRLGSEARQIVKVNKSPVTGRVVSVLVRDNRPSAVNHWGNPYPEGVTKTLLHTVEVERMSPDAYRAPTAEEMDAYEAKEKEAKKARKAAAPAPVPLVNPTDADAERLQALWNAAAMAERVESYKRQGYNWAVTDCEPQTVLRLTQATYSTASKGSYARACTREVFAGGIECSGHYQALEKLTAKHGRAVCQVRRTSGGNYSASRVIVLTDKPQKALPAAVWQAAPVALPSVETVNA